MWFVKWNLGQEIKGQLNNSQMQILLMKNSTGPNSSKSPNCSLVLLGTLIPSLCTAGAVDEPKSEVIEFTFSDEGPVLSH